MAFGLTDSGAKVLIADQERLDRFADIDKALDLQVIAVAPRIQRIRSQLDDECLCGCDRMPEQALFQRTCNANVYLRLNGNPRAWHRAISTSSAR